MVNHPRKNGIHPGFTTDLTPTTATADDMDRDLSSSPALHYEDWLPEWTQLTARASTTPRVPNTACMISTPLNSSHWNRTLTTYPNRDLANFFLQCISQGFRISFAYGSIHRKPSKLNLEGACSHLNVIDEYLQTEINLNRVAGLFPSSSLPSCQISRFGVIPRISSQTSDG